MKKRLALSLAAVAALGLAVPATSNAATATNAFSAACTAGGSSSFTATVRGWYAWTWRTGTTVNGSGYRYLNAGQSVNESTPGAVDTTSKFGVVGAKSRTYSYVTCTSFG